MHCKPTLSSIELGEARQTNKRGLETRASTRRRCIRKVKGIKNVHVLERTRSPFISFQVSRANVKMRIALTAADRTLNKIYKYSNPKRFSSHISRWPRTKINILYYRRRLLRWASYSRLFMTSTAISIQLSIRASLTSRLIVPSLCWV